MCFRERLERQTESGRVSEGDDREAESRPGQSEERDRREGDALYRPESKRERENVREQEMIEREKDDGEMYRENETMRVRETR